MRIIGLQQGSFVNRQNSNSNTQAFILNEDDSTQTHTLRSKEAELQFAYGLYPLEWIEVDQSEIPEDTYPSFRKKVRGFQNHYKIPSKYAGVQSGDVIVTFAGIFWQQLVSLITKRCETL